MRQKLDPNDWKPSEFMRTRRPELFSDSKMLSETKLSRSVLEYHPDTLTNRKQENEFEHCCRKLAEKEICPNLLPQTGPTGGGDSKVDTETYPVADTISLRWYEGIGREPAQERWAFAFSAKKKWRQKVKSDVTKIVDTQRGYKLVYFITNQYVSDRKRAEVEDALGKQHGVDVRIMDRSWIVKCVFENNRIQVAITSLRLTGFDETENKQTGPRDIEHERELQVLEQQIADPERYKGVEYQLAEECLQAALLARQIELPRVEVEGRFQRAERVAERVGNNHLRLRIAYAKAWTTFWWYDDFEEVSRLYDHVEKLAVGTDQAEDLEWLCNLWTVINTTILRGKLDPAKTTFKERTETLEAALNRLAADERRPNNALQARTSRTLMDLARAAQNPKRAEEVLDELKEILIASEGLGSYPLEPLIKIIRELGDHITDSAKYDSLFEYVIKLTERRTSEAAAGKLLLQRGIQKLRAGKNYEAIRLLGRAQQKLAMDEQRSEWILALSACGSAYESAGLLWAARANILAGANLAFSDFFTHGNRGRQLLARLNRLVWIELQLGRVPCILAWIEVTSYFALHLLPEEDVGEAYREQRAEQDIVLGLLLLKTNFDELKWLENLPEILQALHLDASWVALLYALGYEDRLQSEEMIPKEVVEVRAFFEKWVAQPASQNLPSKPELLLENRLSFRSVIVGCEFITDCANNRTSIYLAETILSVLEAFLATGMGERVFPHCSEFHINIIPSELAGHLPECFYDEKATRGNVEIKHREKLDYQTIDERTAFRSWLIELLAHVIDRTFFISNADDYLTRLARDEAGFGRALNNSDIKIAVENILGPTPKLCWQDWESHELHEPFPLKRKLAWTEGLEKTKSDEKAIPVASKVGPIDQPKKRWDTEKFKHSDVKVYSFINQSLWEKAKWKATAYIVPADLAEPPFLALSFADAEAGKRIFNEWLKIIGRKDLDEQLRVAIITGVDKNTPSSYNVVIGTNFKLENLTQSQLQILVSRVNRMDSSDPSNLNRFLDRYKRIGWYVLLPIPFIDTTSFSKPFWEYGIAKKELTIRPAWQIGENDLDLMGLRPGDNPVVPDGVDNPPILNALKQLSNRKNLSQTKPSK